MKTIRIGILPESGSLRGTCKRCCGIFDVIEDEISCVYDGHAFPDGIKRTGPCITDGCFNEITFFPTGVEK